MAKVRVLPKGRTKQDRKRLRQTLGTLRSLTVAPKTRVRYDKALQAFYFYAKCIGQRIPEDALALDRLFSLYMEHLWQEGDSLSLATDGLSGLQDLRPSLRGCLALSWRLVKTWQKCEMPDRAAPLPEDLLQALAGCLLLQKQHEMSLAILVGFYCLLRTGELLALQACHVQISPKQDFAILNLGFTKTSQRTGAEDSVTLRVDFVCRALAKWKSQVSPQTFLVPFSSYLFRQQFDQVLTRLGLSSWGFRPYSLRRGGATMYFQKNPSFDSVRQLGRWGSDRTARVYINDGVARLAEITFDISRPPLKAPFSFFRRTLRLDRVATHGGSG